MFISYSICSPAKLFAIRSTRRNRQELCVSRKRGVAWCKEGEIYVRRSAPHRIVWFALYIRILYIYIPHLIRVLCATIVLVASNRYEAPRDVCVHSTQRIALTWAQFITTKCEPRTSTTRGAWLKWIPFSTHTPRARFGNSGNLFANK